MVGAQHTTELASLRSFLPSGQIRGARPITLSRPPAVARVSDAAPPSSSPSPPSPPYAALPHGRCSCTRWPWGVGPHQAGPPLLAIWCKLC